MALIINEIKTIIGNSTLKIVPISFTNLIDATVTLPSSLEAPCAYIKIENVLICSARSLVVSAKMVSNPVFILR